MANYWKLFLLSGILLIIELLIQIIVNKLSIGNIFISAVSSLISIILWSNFTILLFRYYDLASKIINPNSKTIRQMVNLFYPVKSFSHTCTIDRIHKMKNSLAKGIMQRELLTKTDWPIDDRLNFRLTLLCHRPDSNYNHI